MNLRDKLEKSIRKNINKDITKKDLGRKDDRIAKGVDRFPVAEAGPGKGWKKYYVRG